MNTPAIPCLPNPPNILRASCPDPLARKENYWSSYIWNLNNDLQYTLRDLFLDMKYGSLLFPDKTIDCYELTYDTDNLTISICGTEYDASWEFTIGRITTSGTSTEIISNDEPAACKFTASNTGTLSNMYVYIANPLVECKVKCAIYDSSLALLTNGTTNEQTIAAGAAGTWVAFTFSTPPSVTADASYYLALWSDISINVKYIAGAADQTVYHGLAVYDGWPDPFASTYTFTRELCIYAIGTS